VFLRFELLWWLKQNRPGKIPRIDARAANYLFEVKGPGSLLRCQPDEDRIRNERRRLGLRVSDRRDYAVLRTGPLATGPSELASRIRNERRRMLMHVSRWPGSRG
jgi:hypothetical protein